MGVLTMSMLIRIQRCCLLLGLCMAISACASTSPPTRYYVLTPADEAVLSDRDREDPAGPLVSLGPVVIPSYLDRPQIISRGTRHRLQLKSFEHWAEPIQENISRVLIQNLAGEVPSARVIAFPDRNFGQADYRVLVSIERFEPIAAAGEVILPARWSLFNDRERILCDRSAAFSHPFPDGDLDGILAAMSRALADCSSAMAECLRGALD